MENKQKLQKLLLAEKEEMEKVAGLEVPDFSSSHEIVALIKADHDLSDSQTFLTLKQASTRATDHFVRAKRNAEIALQTIEDALSRLAYQPKGKADEK